MTLKVNELLFIAKRYVLIRVVILLKYKFYYNYYFLLFKNNVYLRRR